MESFGPRPLVPQRRRCSEADIERRLVAEVRKAGGLCLKFTSPSTRGVPDRIVLLPGGVMVFVELKAPGRKPTRLQRIMHERIRALGFRVAVVDSLDGIGEVVA